MAQPVILDGWTGEILVANPHHMRVRAALIGRPPLRIFQFDVQPAGKGPLHDLHHFLVVLWVEQIQVCPERHSALVDRRTDWQLFQQNLQAAQLLLRTACPASFGVPEGVWNPDEFPIEVQAVSTVLATNDGGARLRSPHTYSASLFSS
ncbi:hypothetical protein ACMT4L_20540 [Deinococcus sp. A31D244]|uniref:hypothetical protein n=1 Tax=Deinococcus sp. A31D244 TaxID=3397675 RepID=UPI0039E07EEF